MALTWQSFRLVRHQRAVRDLRRVEAHKQGQKLGELAGEGADTLEKTIARWDARDQWLVGIGLIGITLSFLLKLIGLSIN